MESGGFCLHFSGDEPLPCIGAQARSAMCAMAQFQPVHLEDLGVQQGKVMVTTQILRGTESCRALGAWGLSSQVVGSRCRLLDPLPKGLKFKTVGGNRDFNFYAQLPIKSTTPKGNYRLGLFCKFADFRAACVRIKAKCLLVGVHLSKHYCAGIGRAIASHCGQYRSSPGVVTVYAGAPKLFPDLLANILRCV